MLRIVQTTSAGRLAARSARINARVSVSSFSTTSPSHKWNDIPLAPPDKILGIAEAYVKDVNAKKINLGVGAYRDNSGKPIIFESVKKAETILLSAEKEKEYTGITGSKNFQSIVRNFVFNNSNKDSNGAKLIEQGRIVTAQTISGTGSLRVIGDFLARFYAQKKILVPQPTWANHVAVFKDSGLNTEFYSYYDTAKSDLDFEGLKSSLNGQEEGSIVLLHACCHNPTGMDLTPAQWDEVLEIVASKKFYPLVDMAYQGFSSGDPYKDIGVIRRLNELVVEGTIPSYALCQSFAKNMGLYGERTGSISIVTESAESSKAIESQLKKLIRPIYSSPPIHGSKIVETIFDPKNDLLNAWLGDLNKVVGRLNDVRGKLYENLDKTSYNWDHLLKQSGMFVYTGLTTKQVIRLRDEYSVYATEDGRFSILGINDDNVAYLANAINEIIKLS